ncbi:MAG TPA: formyltransferase family protein [Candidatus Limnocylindrales bacterium]|nr:formyltransferase family protein [Candidatus Limnocylindrales bacterium]
MADGRFSAWLVGSGSLVGACGDLLRANGHDVQAVVSTEAGVIAWAGEHRIPVFARMAEAPAQRRPHHLFSITNEVILAAGDLAVPTEMAINFHSAPLPHYAGVAQTSWAIVDGATEHGVTWHRMTVAIDGGEILVQQRFPIDPDETQLSLNIKCFDHGLRTFEILLKQLASGDLRPTPQEPGGCYRSRSDRLPHTGIVTWDRSAEELERWSRAGQAGPFDNSFGVVKLVHHDEVVAVRDARSTGRPSTRPPGTIVEVVAGEPVIATRTNDLIAGGPVTTGSFFQAGTVVAPPAPDRLHRIDEIGRQAHRFEPFWVNRLERAAIPTGRPGPHRFVKAHQANLPQQQDEHTALAALLCGWQRHPGLSGSDTAPPLWSSRRAQELVGDLWPHWSIVLPVTLPDPGLPFREAVTALAADLAQAERRGTFLRDVAGRYPSCRIGDPPRASVVMLPDAGESALANVFAAVDTELVIVRHDDGRATAWGPSPADPFEVAQRFMALLAFIEEQHSTIEG